LSEQKAELVEFGRAVVAIWKNTMPRPFVAERCTLAHDLNNDLAIIVGDCDLLAELLKEQPICFARLKAIKASAMRMADRIETRSCPTVSLSPDRIA
jgi:hypothetical protein